MADQTVAEVMDAYPPFEDAVPEDDRHTHDHPHTLQVNVGYRCNLACRHCHLQCGPNRTEAMSWETMEDCIRAYQTGGFTSMDVTGGAPEMHPEYERFLRAAHEAGAQLMCRTNLCILLKPEYAHFMDVYAELDVTLVASLPFYAPSNCDKVRGSGIFDASIEAMRQLNERGIGSGEHTLMLVYNPAGAVLPPNQASLEREYKEKLSANYGVTFDSLIAIANNPSGRFAEALNKKGNLGKYMDRLIGAFNVATCDNMMCRDQISVDWQGIVYDCDFNQALGLPLFEEATIAHYAENPPKRRHIRFGQHCYGCTAGAGSSCGGATA